MKFSQQKGKLELGDTLVPDLFILNNMKALGKMNYIFICICFI